MKKEEMKQLIKDNVDVYKDFDDFEKYTGLTQEDVENELRDGFFSDLTPVKSETILSVLKEEVVQDDFLEFEKQLNEDNPDNQTDLNDVGALIEDYLGIYNVFYIESEKKHFIAFN